MCGHASPGTRAQNGLRSRIFPAGIWGCWDVELLLVVTQKPGQGKNGVWGRRGGKAGGFLK